MAKRLPGQPRVFIGLNEVAGYYSNLQKGFSELGVNSRFFCEEPHAFSYGPAAWYGRMATAGRQGRLDLGSASVAIRLRGVLPAIGLTLATALFRAILLCWVIVRFDAVIVSGGGSFFKGYDLVLLRTLGKRIVCVFHGTDHRPPYLNRKQVRASDGDTLDLIRRTRTVQTFVRRVEGLADTVVALPSSAQFHRRPFVDFLSVGIPFDGPPPERPQAAQREADGCVILHSPSDPEAKGTAYIREVVAGLQQRGLAVRLVEVVGRPHTQVLEAIVACDFVVDEMFSDTPMAGFATEAAWFGKPAVVSGFYAALAAEEIRAEATPPTLFCLPHELDDAIERMVVDVAYRIDLGLRAKQFVRSQWSVRQVAGRFLRILQDDVPPEWIRTVEDVQYAHGWGMSETQLRSTIRAVTETGGAEALGLDESPELRAAVLALAQ